MYFIESILKLSHVIFLLIELYYSVKQTVVELKFYYFYVKLLFLAICYCDKHSPYFSETSFINLLGSNEGLTVLDLNVCNAFTKFDEL